METIREVITAVEDSTVRLEEWKTRESKRIDDLMTYLTDMEAKGNLASIYGGGTAQPANTSEQWMDTKSKQLVPVLSHKQSIAASEPKIEGKPSMGRVLRGIVLGGRADDAKALAEERKAMSIMEDTGGGYSVPSALSAEWIDLFRAQMVLSQAGARTIPMTTNTLSLAKLTSDPTTSWHAENGTITDSEASLGLVTMTAKTAVCLVKFSLELAQDSANIEEILQSSIVASMAQAVDSAGLVGVTTDAGVAPMTGTGIFNLTGRNSVTSIGAPTSWDFLADGLYELMSDNVPPESIGAMIAHPALWRKMVKLKTGITNDNTPLPVPAALSAVPKLWTTAAPLTGGTTAKAMIARWSDLLMGVRKDIQIVPLRETLMGTNLQVALLAYVRVDFAATRAASFCSLEGITV